MAHSLGLNVVAEGVETQAQLQFLRAQGCDEIQGFWLSRPLDAHACLAFIRHWGPARAGAAAVTPCTPPAACLSCRHGHPGLDCTADRARPTLPHDRRTHRSAARRLPPPTPQALTPCRATPTPSRQRLVTVQRVAVHVHFR